MRNPHPKLQHFTPQSVYCALKEICVKNELPECFIEMCALSMSEEWEWEYNGISFWPDKEVIVLFAWLHDFMWITGSGGYKSDLIMRYVGEHTGYTKLSMNYAFKIVRAGWEIPLIGYKAKHKKRGNIRSLTPVENQCFRIAKNYYL